MLELGKDKVDWLIVEDAELEGIGLEELLVERLELNEEELSKLDE